MKRGGPGDFAMQKRPRFPEQSMFTSMFNEALAEGKFELRLLIPDKFSGAIIGKGGAVVNGISKKYEAQISLPDRSTPERVLTITCLQTTILDCFREVVHAMTEGRPGAHEVRLIVHDYHAGVIVGKKGAFVKELGDKTDTNITVFKECCPDSKDRVALISGLEENIVKAVEIIIPELAKYTIKNPQSPYDAANYDPSATELYGGFSEAGRGAMIARRADRLSTRPHADDYAMGYESRRRGCLPPEPPSMSYSEDYLRGSDTLTLQMTIPKEMASKFGANGGELMRHIQQESGARVDLSVSITGSYRDIRMAQLLVNDSVRKSEASRYYDDPHVRRSAEVPPLSGRYYDDAPPRRSTEMPAPSNYYYEEAQYGGQDFAEAGL